jgi:hypothetical protein
VGKPTQHRPFTGLSFKKKKWTNYIGYCFENICQVAQKGRSGGKWCGRPGRQNPKGSKVDNKVNTFKTFCAQQLLNYRDKKQEIQ